MSRKIEIDLNDRIARCDYCHCTGPNDAVSVTADGQDTAYVCLSCLSHWIDERTESED